MHWPNKLRGLWRSCVQLVIPTPRPPRGLRFLDDQQLYLAYKYKPIPEGRTLGGSFGDVRICHQVGQKDVLVAIKFPRYSEDEQMNMRMDRALEKEIKHLQLCKHPNILRYLGLTRADFTGGVGIVCPFALGRSLPTHLKDNNAADRYKLVREVAAGLAYLHSPTPDIVVGGEKIHIVHGDIHPGNVLVMSDGRAVLSDFGLSKLAREGCLMSMTVRTGSADGVAEYLAPEVHKLEDVQLPAGVQSLVDQGPEYAGRRTVKSDVFAFGMLVFTTFRGNVRLALGPASVTPAALIEGKRPKREHTISYEEVKHGAGIKNNGNGGQTRRDEKQVAWQLDDDTWALVCDCWRSRAKDRPTMTEVCRRLGSRNVPDVTSS